MHVVTQYNVCVKEEEVDISLHFYLHMNEDSNGKSEHLNNLFRRSARHEFFLQSTRIWADLLS